MDSRLSPEQERFRAERGNGSCAAPWQGSPGAVSGTWWQYRALRSRGGRSRGYWPSGRVTNSKVSISTRKRRSDPDDESLISNGAVVLALMVPDT